MSFRWSNGYPYIFLNNYDLTIDYIEIIKFQRCHVTKLINQIFSLEDSVFYNFLFLSFIASFFSYLLLLIHSKRFFATFDGFSLQLVITQRRFFIGDDCSTCSLSFVLATVCWPSYLPLLLLLLQLGVFSLKINLNDVFDFNPHTHTHTIFPLIGSDCYLILFAPSTAQINAL